MKFGRESESCLPPDLEWYREMTCTVKSIEYKKATILDNLNLDYVDMLNKDVDDLRKCIVSQLPQFVSNHIPIDKKYLYPGAHWIWDSFRYLLPKLCAVVVTSEHVVTGDDLLHWSISENLLSNHFKFMELEILEEHINRTYLIFNLKKGTRSLGVDVVKWV